MLDASPADAGQLFASCRFVLVICLLGTAVGHRPNNEDETPGYRLQPSEWSPRDTAAVAIIGDSPGMSLVQDDGTSWHEQIEKGSLEDGLGYKWSRCAGEGQHCSCSSGIIRYGIKDRWLATHPDDTNFSHGAVCNNALFGGLDPAAGRSKECYCQEASTQSQTKLPGVAVVMLSREPADVKTWLQYHLHHAGVNHVFMTVEDTPQFQKTWGTVPKPDRDRVTLKLPSLDSHSGDRRPWNNYTTLQTRQREAMADAKRASKEMGIEWLFHIDDDELLYVPTHRPVGEIFASSVPKDTSQVFVTNKEAIYNSADVAGDHCFTDTSMINMNPYTFVSYANGKSAVRASDENARPAGPHNWNAQRHFDKNSNSWTSKLPSMKVESKAFGPPLWLLHFESCPYSRWKSKYWELGNTSPEEIKKIPFPFYKQSIQRMQSCRGDASALETRAVTKECSESGLQDLWSSWKTLSNTRIKAEDLMPVNIPWRAIKGE